MTWLDRLQEFADRQLLPFGLRILIALAIFWIGRMVARQLVRMFDRFMESSRVDVSLRKFLRDVAYAVMLVAVIIAALDAIGIETTAVVAVLGAAGLAVGLALQGSLSNFAAGVMLIVLRPYKVGDQVVIGKHIGRVEAIKVFHTIVVTADNREVTIPNGQVIAQPIENLTTLGERRIDLVVTVTGAPPIDSVKQIVRDAIAADPQLARTTVEVCEMTDAAVKLYVRPWVALGYHAAAIPHTIERLHGALLANKLTFSIVQSPLG